MITVTKKYYADFEDLKDLLWAGAQDTLKVAEILGVQDELVDCLESITPEEGSWDSVTLNDFVWFDADYIFTELLEIEEARVEDAYGKLAKSNKGRFVCS